MLHDPLTELPNRLLFHDRVHQAILGATRTGTRAAVIVLDVDRFKEINDALGHHMGDLLLYELGYRLTETLRQSDSVARLGGDEFAILLPEVEDDAAALAAAARRSRSSRISSGVISAILAGLSSRSGRCPGQRTEEVQLLPCFQ